jgi:hypothetical protein
MRIYAQVEGAERAWGDAVGSETNAALEEQRTLMERRQALNAVVRAFALHCAISKAVFNPYMMLHVHVSVHVCCCTTF